MISSNLFVQVSPDPYSRDHSSLGRFGFPHLDASAPDVILLKRPYHKEDEQL